jgi:hypothetical protein
MNTLQYDLRVIIASHGLENVHIALNEYMQQEYEFLTRLLNTPSIYKQPQEVLQHQAPEHQQQSLETKVKNVKIRVKKSVPEAVFPEPQPTPVEPLAVAVENIIDQQPAQSPNENKFRNPEEMKEFQRIAVEKKHAELQAIDVSAASILTKENLKKWVEEEGNTYAWVAREKAGVPETEVAAIAKSHGIVSKISKRRGVIIAQKKRSS